MRGGRLRAIVSLWKGRDAVTTQRCLPWIRSHCQPTERSCTEGELDLASCAQLRDALNTELGAGRAKLVLDMADLEFIDSTGLSVLVEFSKKTSRAGGQLALAGLKPQPAKTLKIVGLDRKFPIYATSGDAAAEIAEAAGAPPA